MAKLLSIQKLLQKNPSSNAKTTCWYSYGSIVSPCLRSRGVNRLDGFIPSHTGASYTGAAASLENDFAPKRRTGLLRGIPAPVRGDLLQISGPAKIRVLYPPPGLNARAAADKALVLRLETAGTRVLFMPGSSPAAERWLLQNESDLRSAILVTNQHGVETSDDLNFLKAVQPKAIVCLAPKFPPSTHIDEAWAAEVTNSGIHLLRQDETGAVRIDLNPGDFTIHPFLGNQIFHSRN